MHTLAEYMARLMSKPSMPTRAQAAEGEAIGDGGFGENENDSRLDGVKVRWRA